MFSDDLTVSSASISMEESERILAQREEANDDEFARMENEFEIEEEKAMVTEEQEQTNAANEAEIVQVIVHSHRHLYTFKLLIFLGPLQPPETVQPKLKRRTSVKKMSGKSDSKQTEELIEKLKKIEMEEIEITDEDTKTSSPSPSSISPSKGSLPSSPKLTESVKEKSPVIKTPEKVKKPTEVKPKKKVVKVPEINPLMPSTETPEAMVIF